MNQVSQDQLDKALEEVQHAIDKKFGKEQVEQAAETKVKEVMEDTMDNDKFQEQLGKKVGGAMQAVKEELGKKVGEERLVQATHNIQIMVDQKVNGVAQTMQAVSTASATKVTRDQLS